MNIYRVKGIAYQARRKPMPFDLLTFGDDRDHARQIADFVVITREAYKIKRGSVRFEFTLARIASVQELRRMLYTPAGVAIRDQLARKNDPFTKTLRDLVEAKLAAK